MEDMKTYIFTGMISYFIIHVAYGVPYCKEENTYHMCETDNQVQGNKCQDVPDANRIISAEPQTSTSCAKADYPLAPAATGQYTWNGANIYVTEDCRDQYYVKFESCYEATANITCSVHGDPHFTTFDGETFTFNGPSPCNYVLAGVGFIQFWGTFVKCNKHATCLQKLMAFTFDAKIYTIGPKDAVEVKQPDGTINQLTLPFETNNIRIEEAGKYIKVTLINFVNRSLNCIGYWDKKNSAIIVISPAFKGAFSGVGRLCGDFDGVKDNDLGGLSLEEFGLSSLVESSWQTGSPNCTAPNSAWQK